MLRNGAQIIANNHCNTVYIEVSKRQDVIKSMYNLKVKCKADI